MIDARFRPVPIWPNPTPPAQRRSRWTFRAGWADTLELLENELRHLNATNIAIGCGLREQDIRNDGWPRANAREPAHPGIEVSFDTPHGRLAYATDAHELWQHNVRAIAKSLEALRAVDRYGATSGQQYAGFKALPSGNSDAPSPDRGRQLIDQHGGIRAARMATHHDRGGNDRGGNDRDFKDVQAAIEAGAR